MTVIYCIIIFIAVLEFANFVVYGGFVSAEIEEFYMNVDESKISINSYNHSIFYPHGHRGQYTTNLPFSVFSKYHIDGVGTVPRWSKLHKRLKEYHVIALKNLNK